LKSVIETLKWCDENNVKKIRINYDYEGIEKFAAGKWKSGNELSKDYVNFIRQTKVEIEWRHIKSHTGNIKNDKADLLAKRATSKL
jgi:ribonuclease HI